MSMRRDLLDPRALEQRLISYLRNQAEVPEINTEGFLDGIRYDAVVTGPGSEGSVYIEVSSQAIIDKRTAGVISDRFRVLQRGGRVPERVRYLLIYGGSISPGAQEALDKNGVIVRSARILEDSQTAFWTALQPEYEEHGLIGEAQRLIQELNSIPHGRMHAVAYEDVCKSILEFLFCPELGPPKTQVPNFSFGQRRDLIMRNDAQDGFWARTRERYKADYLLVEFKNSGSRVGNKSIWQLAGYIEGKGHGALRDASHAKRRYGRCRESVDHRPVDQLKQDDRAGRQRWFERHDKDARQRGRPD